MVSPEVSYPYISRIEGGHRNPSLKVIRALAAKLGVTPEYLETGEELPSPLALEFSIGDAELELRLGSDYERAEAAFREALAGALRRENEQVAARAYAGLGLIDARRGRPETAVTLLEQAAQELPLDERPDIYEALGEALAAAGRGEEAVDFYERCLVDVQERAPDNAALRARFCACLAEALSALGALEPARKALNAATDATRELGVPGRARIHWTEAITAWQAGDSERAVMFVHRAIGLLEASEDTLYLARTHLLAGRMFRLDGDLDAAAGHLKCAERMFTLGGKTAEFGVLRAEQAHLAVRRGEPKAALVLAQAAESLVGDDARFGSNVNHAYAAAYAALGDVDQAEPRYRAAIGELEQAREWREAASVMREFAQLLRITDREDEAYELVDRAAEVVVQNGVGRDRTAAGRDS